MKTVMTITGIRPDFIRMSEIFRKLDESFHHVLIHTGQHFDTLLSDVFFDELEIRKPDYNLHIGGPGKEHFHQTAELSIKLIELIRSEHIDPDIILFLGDSNSVTVSMPLKKEGYRIGHIEAGMRSYDRRMLEEINRVVCDHCSDLLFVYHEHYAENLKREGITNGVHVIGNTIVEVCSKYMPKTNRLRNKIILDIHRPENFKYPNRLKNIVRYANMCADKFGLPVEILSFHRTMNSIKEFGVDLDKITPVDLYPYKRYLQAQHDALFLISDSGTAQEEPALLGVPVIVPRDFTERPESVVNKCSFMVDMNTCDNYSWQSSLVYINDSSYRKMDVTWLGPGMSSTMIVESLHKE